MQYDSCKRLSTEIIEKLTTHKRPETLQEYTRIFSDIRTCLKTYNHDIQQLKNNVDDTLKFKAMYPFIYLFIYLFLYSKNKISQHRNNICFLKT